MGSIKLKTGKMPESENEIAVEAEVLDALSLSYETGQNIHLSIRLNDGEIREKDFILSGVLENYSSRWNTPGELLRFITAGPFDDQSVTQVFIEPKAGYEESLKMIRIADHPVFYNSERLISDNPFTPANQPITLAVILAVVLCAVLSLEMILSWIWKKTEEIRLLRISGIHRKTIRKDIKRMLIKAGKWPFLIMGLVIMILVSPFYGSVLLLFTCLLISIVYGVTCCLINRIPLLPSQKAKKDSPVKKRLSSKKQETLTVQAVSRRFGRKMNLCSGVMLLVLIVSQIVILYCGSNIIHCTKNLITDSGFDYQLTGLKISEPNSAAAVQVTIDFYKVPGPLLTELEENRDLEVINTERYMRIDYVSWPEISESLLVDPATGEFYENDHIRFRPDSSGVRKFSPKIWEISDPDEIRELQSLIGDGNVDWKEWKQGKEVIMVLPEVVVDDSGMIQPSTAGNTEKTIQSGDLLTFENMTGSSQIKLSGIIRNPHTKYPPYSILRYGEDVNRIDLNLKHPENKVPVELYLSKISSNSMIQFRNRRDERERVENSIWRQIIINIFVLLVLTSISLIILSVVRLSYRSELSNSVRKLYLIGLPKSMCIRVEETVIKRNSLIMLILSSIITALYIILMYIENRTEQTDVVLFLIPYLIFSIALLAALNTVAYFLGRANYEFRS